MLNPLVPPSEDPRNNRPHDPIIATADALETCTCGLFGGETPFGPSDMVVPEALVRQLRELGGSPRACGISTTWLVVRQMRAWLALPDNEFNELFSSERAEASELKGIISRGIGEVRALYHKDILEAVHDSMANDVNFISTLISDQNESCVAAYEPEVSIFLEQQSSWLSSLLIYVSSVCNLGDDVMSERDKNEISRTQHLLVRSAALHKREVNGVEHNDAENANHGVALDTEGEKEFVSSHVPDPVTSKALRSLESLGADIVSKFERSKLFPLRQELPFSDDYKLRSIIVFLRDLKEALGFLAEIIEEREVGRLTA